MIAALAHPVSTSLGSRQHTLNGPGTIYEDRLHHQATHITAVILLSPVAYGRHHQFTQRGCTVLRMVLKKHGAFPNDDAILKVMWLALDRITKKWTMPLQNWKAALNQMYLIYGGRFEL